MQKLLFSAANHKGRETKNQMPIFCYSQVMIAVYWGSPKWKKFIILISPVWIWKLFCGKIADSFLQEKSTETLI